MHAQCDDYLKQWEFEETVGDWINSRLNAGKIAFKKMGKKSTLPKTVEELSEKTGVGTATIYRLKKCRKYYFPSNTTRESLSKIIGYYGYPSYDRDKLLVDFDRLTKNLIPGGVNRCMRCNRAKKYFLSGECTSEYLENFPISSESGAHPDSDYYEGFREFGIVKDELDDEDSFIFYVSSNKLYGVISPFYTDGFEVFISLCRKCIESLRLTLVESFSVLLSRWIEREKISQSEVLNKIGLSQSSVSKICAGSVDYFPPYSLRIFLSYMLFDEEDYLKIDYYVKHLERSFMSMGYSGVENKKALFVNGFSRSGTEYFKKSGNETVFCDVFAYSDAINVACFSADDLNVRVASFLLSVSFLNGATHVLFYSGSSQICIDVRKGFNRVVEVPFPLSYLSLRSLSDRTRYSELDDAILRINFNCSDIDYFRSLSVHLKNELPNLFYMKEINEPKYDFFSLYSSESEEPNLGVKCVGTGFDAVNEYFSDFDVRPNIHDIKNSWDLDFSQRFLFHDMNVFVGILFLHRPESENIKKFLLNFKVNIYNSVQGGVKTKSEICDSYFISEDVLDSFLSNFE